MKALTICQPYAELICTLEKRVENRTWPTRYRGPLWIHAGKSRDWLRLNPAKDYEERYGIYISTMAFGALVARAALIDCLHIDAIDSGRHDEQYPWLRSHEHVEGEWCWLLADVIRLDRPIPWKGELGLFNVSDDADQATAIKPSTLIQSELF